MFCGRGRFFQWTPPQYIVIAAQAFLLQHNLNEISAVIKDTATMSESETQAALEDCEFAVQNRPHFMIVSRRRGETPNVQ
jgi:hypothetical protein